MRQLIGGRIAARADCGWRIMRRAHVSRGRADTAYVGTAHTTGVTDDDYRNSWTSSSERKCSGTSGRASSAESGRSAAVRCDGRQSDDFSRGAGSAETDVHSSEGTAQSRTVRIANRDDAEDQSHGRAKLSGRAGAQIAKGVPANMQSCEFIREVHASPCLRRQKVSRLCQFSKLENDYHL
jgi:hypothetical protein